MGFAAGVLVAVQNPDSASVLWSFLGAVSISGTLQFLICDWYRDQASLAYVAAMTLAVSFRYALYGFSLITRWSGVPLWKKLILIWGLADENYALETLCRLRNKADYIRYSITLTLLDVSYWIGGCVLGAFAGEMLPIPNKGIEFVMVALFISILTDQIRDLLKGGAAK